MKSKIDINVDLGEGFNNESSIMPFISSVNIACGGHAGSEQIILECVELALKHKVRIGAHPGFEDKLNFGRKVLNISLEELRASVLKQINQLESICNESNTSIAYVKPHGALYHLVCNELEYAQVVVDILKNEIPNVALMGLPNCRAEELAEQSGVKYIKEGFADRVYEEDGNLRDRKKEEAVWTTYSDILNQVLKLSSRESENLLVDSICFHGDHEGSVELIKRINKDLIEKGFEIAF